MELPPPLLPYRDAIECLCVPSATFEPLPASSLVDPKASRIGGTPFSPIYTDWPSSMIPDGHLATRKRPQAFIGQFNFREIVTAVPELQGVVPSEGLFQLFYDTEEWPWGTYPQDFNFITTVWYPDIEELRHVPMDVPPVSYPERQFGLKFSYRPSYPDGDRIGTLLDLPEDAADAYADWLENVEAHQIGGYPLSIQSDVIEVFEEMSESSIPWHLLLQIGSDEKMGICWGDVGTIYVGVQTEDLSSGDISQIRLTLQCY